MPKHGDFGNRPGAPMSKSSQQQAALARAAKMRRVNKKDWGNAPADNTMNGKKEFGNYPRPSASEPTASDFSVHINVNRR